MKNILIGTIVNCLVARGRDVQQVGPKNLLLYKLSFQVLAKRKYILPLGLTGKTKNFFLIFQMQMKITFQILEIMKMVEILLFSVVSMLKDSSGLIDWTGMNM